MAADSKTAWVAWATKYGLDALFDSLIESVQDVESKCVNCGATIHCDIVEGGGVPDWHDEGDYGCPYSPDTTDDGCGGHRPRTRYS
jgi:hypothetical protein